MTSNENTVIAFLKMMEERVSQEELEKFYHPEVEQKEFPNAITKHTAVRNLADLKKGAEKGRSVITEETYEVVQLHSCGETVILEAIWRGILAIQLGSIPAGGTLTAYFAQFFEFKDGMIYRQRNYDCFEPFT